MTMNIKVYGPGCARCEQLEEKLRLALAEEGTEASVEKVTDPARIAASGILSLPGLEINGCMKCSGRVPEPAEIRYWLREATRTTGQTAAASSPGCGCEGGGGGQAASACSCNSSADAGQPSGASCSCGSGSGSIHATGGSCGCGTNNGPAASSSCCGGKRLLTIIVLILVAVACVRLIAKQVYGDAATAPQGSAAAPAAAPAEAPKAAEGAKAAEAAAPQAERVTEVVYFLYGARCVTCINMEKWARETVEAMQPETPDLVFAVREATAGDVQKYGLQTKGVVLCEWRNGRELRSFNAIELWQSVRSGEEAYKNALRRLIEAFRAENQATPSEATHSEATPSEAPSAA